MQPRLVFRTHYQVDEPVYLEILIRLCTSPKESAYREVISERLANEIRRRKTKFNVPAAAYAVDLARGLGLINDQYRWSDLAHVVNLLSPVDSGDDELEQVSTLNDLRKLMHFRVFLEGDGAALTFLGKAALEHGGIGSPGPGWNELAQSMFESVYYEYLQITTSTADRVKLRTELDRVRLKGYEGKSGAHKIFIHAQTMHRLGLLERAEGSGGRKYRLPEIGGRGQGLRALVELVPTVAALEEVVAAGTWAEVAAPVFLNDHRPWMGTDKEQSLETTAMVIETYRRVLETGVPLAPIVTVRDILQVRLLSKGFLFRTEDFMSFISDLQRRSPRDVRFHVDRVGRPAFLKLSDEFVSTGGVSVS